MKKRLKYCTSIILMFVLVFGLIACGNNPMLPESSTFSNRVEDIEKESENDITVIDQAGREVKLEQPAECIVSGYYISSSACIALGLTDRLVGIEAKAESRPIYSMAAPDLLELPNVGSAKEFNMEACIALEPDLVILPVRLKDFADTMTELGIPVILVNPESHQELVEMIILIGEATGTQERAAELVSYYDKEMLEIEELIKSIDERPVVYMGGNGDYLITAPREMFQAYLIESAGGINAAQHIDDDKWIDVSYEQLITMNPDVIVIPPEASYSKEDIINDTQITSINAVRNENIYEMPKDFEAWDSPVLSSTLGIRWLICVLHEDVYSLEMLRTDAAAFYAEFFGIEIDIELINK